MNNWKTRFGSSKIAVVVETGIGVFFDLFGCFEVAVKSIAVIILTIYGCIILANLGASFINAATVVLAEVFAGTVDQQEPVIIFCEHRGIFM